MQKLNLIFPQHSSAKGLIHFLVCLRATYSAGPRRHRPGAGRRQHYRAPLYYFFYQATPGCCGYHSPGRCQPLQKINRACSLRSSTGEVSHTCSVFSPAGHELIISIFQINSIDRTAVHDEILHHIMLHPSAQTDSNRKVLLAVVMYLMETFERNIQYLDKC